MTFLFPLSFFLAAVYSLRSRRQKGDYILVAFAGVMLFLMGTRYYYQVRNHLFLSRLSASEVAGIKIGRTEVTEESDLRMVVAALNEGSWFTSNHGGWAKPVRLVITMRDGQAREYWVGYYLRQEGAVIEFHRLWGGGRWSDGYAFSEKLPDALKQAGVKLPSEE